MNNHSKDKISKKYRGKQKVNLNGQSKIKTKNL